MQGIKHGDDFRVAGSKRVSDWISLRKRLSPGKKSDWKIAFDDFFLERISARYLTPIAKLQSQRELKGEGFSIVTIQCALIEFLAATIEGRIYNLQASEQLKHKFGYSRSAGLFRRFLTTQQPFASIIEGDDANDVYQNVRCALVHEARTKNGWRILAGSTRSLALDVKAKIVYHEGLQTSLCDFVEAYGQRLMITPSLQKGLLRKLDSLCDLPLTINKT